MTSTNTQADVIVANLTSLVLAVAVIDYGDSGIPADQVTNLANAYQAVHVSRRGTVQADVMRAAMSQDGVNMATLTAILDTFSNVSTLATGTRKVDQPNVTLNVALVMSAVYVANMVLADSVTNESVILASSFVTNGLPDEHSDAVLATAQRIVDAFTAKAAKARTSYSDTLATLLDRGTLAEGDVLTADDDAACAVNGDGTVSIFAGPQNVSLSVAAQHFTGHSTNGWAHWQFNGEPVGSLRTN